MSKSRPVGPLDKARGDRLLALRETRWAKQADMLRAAPTLDRIRYQRVESGEDRFTAAALQRTLAEVYGVPMGSLVAYANGEMTLDQLLGGAAPPPPAGATTLPASWRAARPLVRVRIAHRDDLGARAEAYAQAVIASIDEVAASFQDHGLDDWVELSEKLLEVAVDGDPVAAMKRRNPGAIAAPKLAPTSGKRASK